VLRPGRFDEVVEIPLSEEPERREIFEVHLRGKPVARNVKISDMAARSEGFTGAQIASVCNLAALRAVRRAVGAAAGADTGKPPAATEAKALIEAEDLAAALAEVSPKL
jgi:transitional endoplasmic reticulum ATPase